MLKVVLVLSILVTIVTVALIASATLIAIRDRRTIKKNDPNEDDKNWPQYGSDR